MSDTLWQPREILEQVVADLEADPTDLEPYELPSGHLGYPRRIDMLAPAASEVTHRFVPRTRFESFAPAGLWTSRIRGECSLMVEIMEMRQFARSIDARHFQAHEYVSGLRMPLCWYGQPCDVRFIRTGDEPCELDLLLVVAPFEHPRGTLATKPRQRQVTNASGRTWFDLPHMDHDPCYCWGTGVFTTAAVPRPFRRSRRASQPYRWLLSLDHIARCATLTYPERRESLDQGPWDLYDYQELEAGRLGPVMQVPACHVVEAFDAVEAFIAEREAP